MQCCAILRIGCSERGGQRTATLRGGDAGTSPQYLRELVDYWQVGYNWREQERLINTLPQFTAEIEGATVHFVHQRGVGPDAIPIVLSHGYPDSFLRFQKLIPLLADPFAHGGEAIDSFDVIVPSIPGVAFSGQLKQPGGIFSIGSIVHQLMHEHLGYSRYGAHGGDWGSLITEQLARDHRDSVIAIHLTDVPLWHGFATPGDLTNREQTFLNENRAAQQREGAYAVMQGTHPQTLADGLNDSPAGLAAWLVDKFQSLSDCNGDIESRFTKDELHHQHHVVLGNGNHWLVISAVLRHDKRRSFALDEGEGQGMARCISRACTAFAMFPKDLTHPPRQLGGTVLQC